MNGPEIVPEPVWKYCPMCLERYDEQKDPNHLEGCRDARKP
ncbi:MAG: hypothetical protein PHS14_00345 [Elusimicrobia bacterium]|nr:hypothetical protein [Elusimicrobiota bacterium]